MCGRFTQKASPQELAEAFGLGELPVDLGPRYNIAPSQPVLVIANHPGPRRAEPMTWGLVPPWAGKPMAPGQLANARSESAAEKPSFRQALAWRRGLLLMDGFYEWQTLGKHKQPHWFSLPGQQLFGVAALWEPPNPRGGSHTPTTCLLTTEPCETVASLHDRMPVILPPAAWSAWLAQGPIDDADLRQLLIPWPGELLARPVSPRVNRSGIEGPECIEPYLPIAPLLL